MAENLKRSMKGSRRSQKEGLRSSNLTARWLENGLLEDVFPIRMFPKIGVPQNGWFIMENPMNKWMIWGFSHIFGSTHSNMGMSFQQSLCDRLPEVNLTIRIFLLRKAPGCFFFEAWKHPYYTFR